MPQKVNKKIVTKSLILFSVLFIIVLGSLLIFVNDDSAKQANYLPKDSDASALLVIVEPNISVIRGEETISITSGEVSVYRGDKIKTDKNGLGYIIFSDNSIISLDHNTEIEIIEHVNQDESFKVKVKQFLGRTWSRVVNLTGKKSDYQIETSNTMAVIRGTEFGCTVEKDSSSFYTYEGSISVRLKNIQLANNELSIDKGESFTNDDLKIEKVESYEELLALKTKIQKEDTYWMDLIQCLDSKSEVLLEEESYRILNYLIEHKVNLDCKVELDSTKDNSDDENKVKGEEVTSDQEESEQEADPYIFNLSISINEISYDVTCNWSGRNARSYEVSLGTAPQKANVVDWASTLYTSYTFKKATLSSGQTYYCNVRGINIDKSTNILSSEGQYLDLSSGNFNLADFDPNTNGTYTGKISGKGSYYNIPLDHLKVKFSIQNEEGEYFNGSAWKTTKSWFITNPYKSGSGYEFQKTLSIPPSSHIDLYFEIYNHYSGKVLDSSSVYNVKCSG